MKSSEVHRKNFSRTFEKKLFNPRSLEGTPNKDAIAFLRELNQEFLQYPWYVGVTLRGSTALGYSTLTSDLDVSLLVNSDDFPEEMKTTFDVRTQVANKLKEKSKFKIHFFPRDLAELKDIHHAMYIVSPIGPESTLAALCEMVIGPKVEQYRSEIGKRINLLESRDRKEVSHRIIERLLELDYASGWKIGRRIPQTYNDGALYKTREERKRLWEKRVKKVLGLI